MTSPKTGTLKVAVALVTIGVGYFTWQRLKPRSLPDGIASGNGRIEAVEIDIATKIAGRIKHILVNEGDFVSTGQTLANMDTQVLTAQRKEAQLQGAIIGVDTAKVLVVQRKAEKQAATATVAQREAELEAKHKRFLRTEKLVKRETAALETLDNDRAQFEGSKAAVSAAQAQVAEADAAIGAAESQVVDAQAKITAAQATIRRIQADIDDSALKSPRNGRVQFRIAQPGEVLSAGGGVLNMVDLVTFT